MANAIPKITDEFNSVSDIGWYGSGMSSGPPVLIFVISALNFGADRPPSAYLFTTSALQLFFGKAYSNFSIKGTYLLAVAIFELGSLVCGLAPTSTALIIGRAVAGIGGSGIFTGALTIIAHSAPLRLRPLMVGLMGGSKFPLDIAELRKIPRHRLTHVDKQCLASPPYVALSWEELLRTSLHGGGVSISTSLSAPSLWSRFSSSSSRQIARLYPGFP